MPDMDDQHESEVYFEEDFDYQKHKDLFESTVDDLSEYIEKCKRARRIRTCDWDGKNQNLTKDSEDAFPFPGASDSEVWLAQDLMSKSTAINMNALRRAQIQAYPRKATDVKRASEVSVLLKYFRDAGIENFWREAELADNYDKEKGIMVTYYGYCPPKYVPHLKKFSEEDILETIPELADMMFDETRVSEVVDMFNQVEGWQVNEKRAKKALKQLRKTGMAEIPVLMLDEGKAEVMTLAPDTEFYCPVATQNFQDANVCWTRKPLTKREITARVSSEGWDPEWAEAAREQAQSRISTGIYGRHGASVLDLEVRGSANTEDLIDVVWEYQRLIDEEDGAEGIYLTVWSPDFGGEDGKPAYAKRTLLSGLKKFPFVVTSSYDAKTLYSATNWPDQLKSIQKSKKILRDSNNDESSYAISPALIAPPTWDHGRPQPGGVYTNRPGQAAPSFLDKNSRFDVTLRLDTAVTEEAAELMGLRPDSPYSEQKNMHRINRFLGHNAEVLKGLYEAYKMNGPDSLYLRVTGNPQGMEFLKSADEAEMSVAVSFNSLYEKPEQMKELRETIMQVAQMDPNGRVNMEAGIDMILNIADPMLADVMLLPTEVGQDKIIEETQKDIERMYAGMARPAPTNAAQLRLQTVEQYFESPTGQAKIAGDDGFNFLLQEYVKQLEFQITQQENAQIGKIGTNPAMMGNINTQEIGNAG